MIKTLDNHCKTENNRMKNNQECIDDEDDFISAYDFLYLPIDFT